MSRGELEFLVGRQVQVGAKFDNPLRWWKNFSQLKTTWTTKWNFVSRNFFVSFIMEIEVELKVGHLNRGWTGGDDGFGSTLNSVTKWATSRYCFANKKPLYD